MKVLQVIQSAFRTLVEEQDDTIIWLCENLHTAGADMSILLSGQASYYAVQSKPQPAIKVGAWQQTQPANIVRDIANLVDFKVPVYVLQEDLAERGLSNKPRLPGIQQLTRPELTNLYESFDQIWQW